MPATKTLPQCAHDAIESAIKEAADEDPVVLWWDEGGYLREIVRKTSSQLGCEFRAAEQTPLELRAKAPRGRTVWYVPQASSDDVDWFKDLEHTGDVIEQHVGKLAARCFENDRLQSATIRTAYEDADERENVAKTLYEELNGEGGLPSLQSLQTKIVLDGHDDPIQFVLENGEDNLPGGDELLEIRDLLVESGVAAAEGVTEAESIVERTRRWGIAEWLVDAGLDESKLDEAYRPPSKNTLSISRPELRSVLSKTDQKAQLAGIYLGSKTLFWSDLVADLDDPWELADCPVGPALEHRLWRSWSESFADNRYADCESRAKLRSERLRETYGDVAWARVWQQAQSLATLAGELDSWEGTKEGSDVIELYGDIDEGTWQIDRAVHELTTSGAPERDLPDDHPASESLKSMRSSLVERRYLEYLDEMGDLVLEELDTGLSFAGEKHAHQFFAEEQDQLQSGQSVALFIIDALRFDLAHELADRIRDELPELELEENRWIGTLPSDTEFGKAALTPGNKFSFNIASEDGQLMPERNGQKITNYRRNTLLENDGWNVITRDGGNESGWSGTRVAYYWNDIDDAGEKELTDFDAIFDNRIEKAAKIICRKLRQGEWDRAYILSDHGFVSLPESVTIDDLLPPDEAVEITRRWVSGMNIDDTTPGRLLTEDSHLGYLDSDVRIGILADPLERFRNQGLPDARFYHGGILPQEFVLNFVTITQE